LFASLKRKETSHQGEKTLIDFKLVNWKTN